jgi:DNA processing protein
MASTEDFTPLADAVPRARKKYVPPTTVQVTKLRAALDGTPRDNLGKKQLDWLSAGPGEESDLTLYLAGNRDLLKRRSISVIGTRKVSDMGALRAHKFARELAEAGVVVVSGLAAGVDTFALAGAMKSGGSVVAVIGTPLDQAYPADNAELQELIYREHLLVSQFPAGQRVFRSNFPTRNRTMAALSDGSVIIEAGESSGTLHQAAECVRLDRWLGLSRAVVEDRRLTWPARFLDYSRCIVLDDTRAFIERVYGSET